MLDVAGQLQLRALHEEQHQARTAVEAHMAAYEAAVTAHTHAQRREAELRALLHSAEARTRQLRQALDDAAAHLGDATLHLSRTQYTCNALGSRLAEHVHCQRAAILLPSSSCDVGDGADDAAEAAPLPPPRLCRVDPFSLLDTHTGEGVAVDLVDVARRLPLPLADTTHAALEPWMTGIYADEADPDGDVAAAGGVTDGSAEEVDHDAEVEAALPVPPTLTSLLLQVVRDVLNGYSHTCFCTAAAGHHEDQGGADPSALCLRLLHLLQREALRRGTRALGVTLAVGCVDAETGAWRDVLQPAAVRHGQPTLVVDAVPRPSDDADGDVSSRDRNPRSFSWCAGRGSSSSGARARSHNPAATPSPASPSTSLAGVPIQSLDEAAYWLTEAGVSSTGPGGVVVVLGIDSQDAAGGLHKSLLRILSDDFNCAAHAACRSRETAAPTPQRPPSVLSLYMRHVLEAAAGAALPEVERERAEDPIAYYLASAVGPTPLPAHKLRAIAAASSQRHCPLKAQHGALSVEHAAAAAAAALDSAWALWAALVRPVFGGNSKAMWVHHSAGGSVSTHRTGSRHRHSGKAASVSAALPTSDACVEQRRAASRNASSSPPPPPPVDALRLCAAFCRLVRHAAAPAEVSPQLAQLLRCGGERR